MKANTPSLRGCRTPDLPAGSPSLGEGFFGYMNHERLWPSEDTLIILQNIKDTSINQKQSVDVAQ